MRKENINNQRWVFFKIIYVYFSTLVKTIPQGYQINTEIESQLEPTLEIN